METNQEPKREGKLDPSDELRMMPGNWDLSSMPGRRRSPETGRHAGRTEAEMDAESGAERAGSGLLPPYFDPEPPFQHWGDLI
ncbi:MAG: hypothetical protein L0Z70_13340 [Chloroflexi bacterium]|nr:hypothetical protein [Chloroflexota bacterium]